MPVEHTTVVVSVNTEWDEETRMQHVNAQVGDGWTVQSVLPISGGGMGPGGASEDFLRLQVILRREVDDDGVIVRSSHDAGAADAGAAGEETGDEG